MLTTGKTDDYFQKELIWTNSKEKKELVEEFEIQKTSETFRFRSVLNIFPGFFSGIYSTIDIAELTYQQ